MSPDFTVAIASEFIDDCFSLSKNLSMVVLNKDFTINAHNFGFVHSLGYAGRLTGKELKDFLLPESHHLLDAAIIDRKMPVRLNFRTKQGSCLSKDCRLGRQGEHYLLFSDHSIHSDDIMKKMSVLNNEMAAMTRELNRKNRALSEAHSKIKILGGIIPICSYCKGIRNDEGYWKKLEEFITENSEARFSHGICDTCMSENFGEKHLADFHSKKQLRDSLPAENDIIGDAHPDKKKE